ncbi:MAG: ATP-binding protein [Planctomycetota bacterium]
MTDPIPAHVPTERRPTTSLVRRLFPSLVVLVLIPLCAAVVLLWHQHQERMEELIAEEAASMTKDLEMILSLQAAGLATVIQPIAADVRAQQNLSDANADDLLRAWRPVFAAMQRDNHVTHLYFYDRNRVCLLRVHAPDQRGDRIDRHTILEAEHTGKMSYGMEFGPRGTFTLRVVQPIFGNGKIIGYVEVGKEIEKALRTLHGLKAGWSQLAVVVQKARLDRQAWEKNQSQHGREANWGRLHHYVVVFASQGHLPDAFAAWVDTPSNMSVPHRGETEVVHADKLWRILPTPLLDVSGARIGDLLAMRDITENQHALIRQLVVSVILGLLLLGLVLTFIYRLLARADLRISAQQALVRNERWRLASIIEATRAGTWEWDIRTGSVIISERWAHMLGYSCEELGAMNRSTWEGLFHPDDLRTAKELLDRHFSGALPFLVHEGRLKHKDGHWVWILCRGRCLNHTDVNEPQLMFGTHMDITARKESEEERERLRKMQQASERAEILQSNRLVALGTLMAGLAHEFNHPAQVVLLNQRSLRAIVEACVAVAKTQPGNASGLLTWNEIAELAPSLLDDMELATTYLQELIENVRGYASPNDNESDRIDSAVMIAVSVASLRLVSSYARRRQVALASPLIGATTVANVGCSRLQQVVVNLLINAIQASKPGDTVSLELDQADGTNRLIISDAGGGIDPQVIDRLGKPFVTTKSSTGGSGLGLYICHLLVTELGGTLALAPRLPHGTRACVEFPYPRTT